MTSKRSLQHSLYIVVICDFAPSKHLEIIVIERKPEHCTYYTITYI